MIDPAPPAGIAPDQFGPRRRRSTVHALDVVPIGPALVAAVFGFLLLLFAPLTCRYVLGSFDAQYIHDDPISLVFVLANWGDSVRIAGFGALGFLVIGMMLQVWRHRRPFRARWAALLAWPVALGLIALESALSRGSLLTAVVVSVAVAFAFAVQWGVLVVVSEEWT